jgi:hypothetical protein
MNKKIIGSFILFAIMTTFLNTSLYSQDTKVLRHVVLFKFKDGTSAADMKMVEDAFRALPSKIKEIKAFEWGTNNSPEQKSQGFTHCFFLSFASEKDRDIYLPHPAHKAFGDILGSLLDKVLVIDYWASK